MNWIKGLFSREEATLIYEPEPKLFSAKNKNISEPIISIMSAWKKDPKRFKIIPTDSFHNIYYGTGEGFKYRGVNSDFRWSVLIQDTVTWESFKIGMNISREAWEDVQKERVCLGYRHFGRHKVYPVLGCEITNSPSWMTGEEVQFIVETVTPYYLKRVNRYRDILESRVDRSRRKEEMKSSISKALERMRLVEIYK